MEGSRHQARDRILEAMHNQSNNPQKLLPSQQFVYPPESKTAARSLSNK